VPCFALFYSFFIGNLLSDNDLTSLSQLKAEKFPNLEQLELRGNKLQTTKGLSLPKLRLLYMVRKDFRLKNAER
jgi:hypothetical protein